MSKYNYFKVVTIVENSFPDSPQVNIGFLSQSVSLVNRSNQIIEYSFNGTDLHGDMNPDDATNGLVFDGRGESKIFFRVASGTGIVRVEAWGNWGRS